MVTPKNMLLPHLHSYHANFGHSAWKCKSVINGNLPRNLTPRILLFKVTQGRWNPHGSIGYLLLVIDSNHGPISYRFRDKWRFWSKITNFTHPCTFIAPTEGVPLEFCNHGRPQENQVMPLSADRMSLTICAFVLIQYHLVTDGQTDRFVITISRSASIGMLTRDEKNKSF